MQRREQEEHIREGDAERDRGGVVDASPRSADG
jgi:hypothetical protein